MGQRKPTLLRLSDEYVRANRERLQRDYDNRQRLHLLREEVKRRWSRTPETPRDVGAAASVDSVGADWVVVRFASVNGVRHRKYRFEIIAGHVLLEPTRDE